MRRTKTYITIISGGNENEYTGNSKRNMEADLG